MYKKVTRSLFCVLCCILLLSFSVLTPVAEALTATMSLSLAVTALAVLIISSIGVTITAPAGQDVTDYVGSRFQSWVSSHGFGDVGSWFSSTTGIGLASYVAHVFSGVLAVGKLAYDAIKSFVEYFVTSEGIEDGGAAVGQVATTPNWIFPNSNSAYFSGSGWLDSTHYYVDCTSLPTNTGALIFFSGIDMHNQTFSVSIASASGNTANGIRAGFNAYPNANVVGTTYIYLSNPSASFTTWSNSTSLKYFSVTGVAGSFTGRLTFDFARYVAAGYSTGYSPGGAVFQPDTNIADLPALTDDQSYHICSDVITGSMSTTAALAAVTNLAASAEGIQVTSAVADEPVNPPSTGPVTGLQDVFPFCLPWDFVRFVGILSATRAAPVFDWIIPIPEDTGLDIGDQYIHIDLSPFDSAAEVLRTAELLASAVGLILLTRELMKW